MCLVVQKVEAVPIGDGAGCFLCSSGWIGLCAFFFALRGLRLKLECISQKGGCFLQAKVMLKEGDLLLHAHPGHIGM